MLILWNISVATPLHSACINFSEFCHVFPIFSTAFLHFVSKFAVALKLRVEFTVFFCYCSYFIFFYFIENIWNLNNCINAKQSVQLDELKLFIQIALYLR